MAESNFYINKEFEYKNRFDLERFIDFNGEYYDILQSPILDQIKKFPNIGQYQISEYPYRPDVVAYNIYGDSQYWPYILLYNGITNIMELELGVVLKIFSIDDLEKVLYSYSNFNRKIIK